MNLLDKIINYFNPKWGAERLSWRSVFDTSSHDNRNSSWLPQSNVTDETLTMERAVAIARTRDLERNTDLASALINAIERNVIGQGIRLDSDNEVLNDMFNSWGADPKQVELGGRFSFRELCKLIVRRTIVDGGIIIQRIIPTKKERNKYGLKIPLILAVREVDELSGIGTGNTLRNGIEYDEWGRAKNYVFRRYDPQEGQYILQEETVPAENIIFLYKPVRATQYREFPLLASANQRIRDVNEILDADLVKSKVNACFSAAIIRQTPFPIGRTNGSQQRPSYAKKTLAPGMIMELSPGESIQLITPPNTASESEKTANLQTRLAGSGLGLSYEIVSRDMSQSNYSSARQGLLEDKQTFFDWQNWLKEHFLINLLKWFCDASFMEYNEDYVWRFPGWSWIDPLKEINSNVAALDSGQTTLAAICGSVGMDWKEVIDQRAMEIEYCKKKGIFDEVTTNDKQVDSSSNTKNNLEEEN